MQYIGPDLIDDINIVSSCEGGTLPVAGGLLDQPAYFLELSTALKRDTNEIEREQSERRRARG